MADTKLTALGSVTPVLTDITYVVDDPGGTPISGKMTLQALMDLFEANMSVDLTSFTITGTTAQFNTALSDGSFATLAGTETLTNKTLTAPVLGGSITGTFTVSGTPTLAADLLFDADGTRDIGSATNRAAVVHTDSIDLNGTTISGTTGDSGVLEDLVTLGAATADNQALVSTAAGVLAWESGATLRTSLGLAIGTDVQAYNQDILFANTADQLTAAFTAAVDDDGTFTTGTYTPSVAAGSNFKQITNNGAFTFAPPTAANDEAVSLTVRIINAASAGAITTSGFTQVTGDAFTTTNTHEFRCYVEVFDDGGTETSLLHVVAMQ